MRISIVATILSAAISNFLLNILNDKVWGVFKPMQRDLCNLSNGTRRILNFAGILLAILITVFLSISLGISKLSSGLILGFLGSTVDICFRNNIVENTTK